MGRDLSWYVLPCCISHDKTKMCIDLEFEPSREELEEFSDQNSEIDVYPYKKEELEKWCPKCFLYVHGVYKCAILKDSISIRHSYSNPIWKSKWNIRNFYMGDSKTDFCKRFDSDRLYREITEMHLKYTKIDFQDLGEPIRTSDKEAYEETMKIIKFIENNLHQDNIIIFQNEY